MHGEIKILFKFQNELDEAKNKLENYKLEVEKKYESYELKLKEVKQLLFEKPLLLLVKLN